MAVNMLCVVWVCWLTGSPGVHTTKEHAWCTGCHVCILQILYSKHTNRYVICVWELADTNPKHEHNFPKKEVSLALSFILVARATHILFMFRMCCVGGRFWCVWMYLSFDSLHLSDTGAYIMGAYTLPYNTNIHRTEITEINFIFIHIVHIREIAWQHIHYIRWHVFWSQSCTYASPLGWPRDTALTSEEKRVRAFCEKGNQMSNTQRALSAHHSSNNNHKILVNCLVTPKKITKIEGPKTKQNTKPYRMCWCSTRSSFFF